MIPYKFNPLGISKKRKYIPLTFIAQTANSTVTLTATGSPTVSGLHYRPGKSGLWLPYTIGTTITMANIGDSVQFWNAANTLSTSSSNYVEFVISGVTEAHGNIQSMVNWLDYAPDYCFYRLFRNCQGGLVKAPLFPAMTVGRSSYNRTLAITNITEPPELPALTIDVSSYENFLSNTKITRAPDLPVVNVPNYAYWELFLNDTSMVEVGRIAAQTVGTESMRSMFYYCRNLTTAPHLKVVNFSGSKCMRSMFQLSRSLQTIEVDFTEWDSTYNRTDYWVDGVAASGTFIKPAALPEEYGVNRIPEGWTVINK
jgi:hypothetical protein